MTKAQFEKCLERALGIYSFYPPEEKKISRERTAKGYFTTSTNVNLIKDLARITVGEITLIDKGAKVFVEISDF